MAITKEKKVAILDKLKTIKDESDSIVFVHFERLSGVDTTAMRSGLREAGVGYFVAKKSLVKRAFKDAFTGEIPSLEGEVALAYSADAIAPASNVKKFADEHKESVMIVGGVFAGGYKTQAEMEEIASIPALPVLRGMFVNVINSPIQGLVIALNQVAEKKA